MNIGKYVDLFTEDLKYKRYSESTISNYSSQVRIFLRDHEGVATKPSEINDRRIKQWVSQGKSVNSVKHRISALKIFYKHTIGQPLKFKRIEYPRSGKRLPRVIDKDKILSAIDSIDNLKHKSIIMLAFSVGLRVSEVINLKISSIDSNRMLIYILNAKGNKDRVVPLSKDVLNTLRSYYKKFKPTEYLFNGQSSSQYSATSCNQIVKKYLGEEYHFHLLRHSSFTAMLEGGTDLRIIQALAGHNSSKTTEIYTHVSNKILSQAALPV